MNDWLQVLRESADLRRKFHESIASLEPKVRRLARGGWTLPMWATPAQTAAIAKMVPLRSLDSFFVRLYSAPGSPQYLEMTQALESSPRLRPWRATLRDILRAYEGGLYRLVIPAALAVFEGVYADTVDHLRRRGHPKTLAEQERKSAARGLESVVSASISEFINQLYKNIDFGLRAPRRLNRNWVHHGRIAPRRSRADALRLLHAIHTVSSSRRPGRIEIERMVRDPAVRAMLQSH